MNLFTNYKLLTPALLLCISCTGKTTKPPIEIPYRTTSTLTIGMATKILSKPVLTEDLILYQIYQEAKCSQWNTRVKRPIKCMYSFPIKEQDRYLLKFHSGFETKEDIEEFNTMDEEEKGWRINYEAEFMQEKVDDLINQIYLPGTEPAELKQLKTFLLEKIDIEYRFFLKEDFYEINIKPNQKFIIKKVPKRFSTTSSESQ